MYENTARHRLINAKRATNMFRRWRCSYFNFGNRFGFIWKYLFRVSRKANFELCISLIYSTQFSLRFSEKTSKQKKTVRQDGREMLTNKFPTQPEIRTSESISSELQSDYGKHVWLIGKNTTTVRLILDQYVHCILSFVTKLTNYFLTIFRIDSNLSRYLVNVLYCRTKSIR